MRYEIQMPASGEVCSGAYESLELQRTRARSKSKASDLAIWDDAAGCLLVSCMNYDWPSFGEARGGFQGFQVPAG